MADTPNRDLNTLRPDFRARLEPFLAAVEAAMPGHKAVVHETLRSAERQAWLFASGRTRDGPQLTWVRRSKHQDGIAADWHLARDGVANWDAAEYQRVYSLVPPADYGLRTLDGDLVHLELNESIAWGDTPAPADRLLILESPDRTELARFVFPPGTELLQRTSVDGSRFYLRFDDSRKT